MISMIQSTTIKEASSQILSMMADFIDVDGLFIAFNDKETNYIVQCRNRNEIFLNETSAPFQETYCSHVCSQDELLVIRDTSVDPRTAQMAITKRYAHVTFFGTPIEIKDGTKVGTVCGFSRQPFQPSQNQRKILETSSQFLAGVFELVQSTFIDPATKAFTRTYLADVAPAMVKESKHASMLVLDMDNFKLINEVWGHEYGDQVLRGIADRLRAWLPKDVVVRVGADSFAVLTKRTENKEELLTLANELLHLFHLPFVVRGEPQFITASIGAARYPECTDDVHQLLRYADIAVHAAKKSGGGCVQYYYPVEEIDAQAHLRIQRELRDAIDEHRLVLHYQPMFHLRKHEISGLEALVRMRTRDGQFIPPADFIPVAEQNGLINRLGKWVLKEACLQNRMWQQLGYSPMVVSVNISPKQFQSHNMFDIIQEVLEETGMEPRWLAIEITEGLLMQNPLQTASQLKRIRSLGVKIQIDDFGTGYSSLSYLGKFEPTHLKIDKSFIDNMLTDRWSMSIVSAIIHLGHNLGMSVIAEGVETVEQLRRLQAEGCDKVQGFLLSKPVSSREFHAKFLLSSEVKTL